jgi:sec-independent protein translocase protein TatB
MFGIGFGELIIIVIVFIVAVGPDKLPTLMKTVGKTIKTVRETSRDLRASIGIDELMREDYLRDRPKPLRALPPPDGQVATTQAAAKTSGGTSEGTKTDGTAVESDATAMESDAIAAEDSERAKPADPAKANALPAIPPPPDLPRSPGVSRPPLSGTSDATTTLTGHAPKAPRVPSRKVDG